MPFSSQSGDSDITAAAGGQHSGAAFADLAMPSPRPLSLGSNDTLAPKASAAVWFSVLEVTVMFCRATGSGVFLPLKSPYNTELALEAGARSHVNAGCYRSVALGSGSHSYLEQPQAQGLPGPGPGRGLLGSSSSAGEWRLEQLWGAKSGLAVQRETVRPVLLGEVVVLSTLGWNVLIVSFGFFKKILCIYF